MTKIKKENIVEISMEDNCRAGRPITIKTIVAVPRPGEMFG